MDKETQQHLEQAFNNVESLINSRFNSLDKDVSEVKSRVEKIDEKLDKTSEKTIENTTEISHIKIDLKEKFDTVWKRMDEKVTESKMQAWVYKLIFGGIATIIMLIAGYLLDKA